MGRRGWEGGGGWGARTLYIFHVWRFVALVNITATEKLVALGRGKGRVCVLTHRFGDVKDCERNK